MNENLLKGLDETITSFLNLDESKLNHAIKELIENETVKKVKPDDIEGLEKFVEDMVDEREVDANDVTGLERFVENTVEEQLNNFKDNDLELDADKINGLGAAIQEKIDEGVDAENIKDLDDYITNHLDSNFDDLMVGMLGSNKKVQEALGKLVEESIKQNTDFLLIKDFEVMMFSNAATHRLTEMVNAAVKLKFIELSNQPQPNTDSKVGWIQTPSRDDTVTMIWKKEGFSIRENPDSDSSILLNKFGEYEANGVFQECLQLANKKILEANKATSTR